MLRALLAGLVLAGVLSPALAQEPVPVPPLQSRVTDATGSLTPGQKAELEQKLAAYEQRKGAQLAALIIASTAPETIEQYSLRVIDAWQLGRAGVDDGVLLLVALDDHAVRIEVGSGLEGVLPDATAWRIIEETIKPLFRQQDIHGGVSAGLDRIMRVVDGEPLPPPDRGWRRPADRIGGLLPLLVFGVIAVGGVLRSLLGRPLGALATGGAAGGVVWLISKVLAFSIGAGVLAFLFSLLMGLGGGGTRGGRFGGPGWPGGFGGGFGGLGGFRGGGGGFSGGGASGRW